MWTEVPQKSRNHMAMVEGGETQDAALTSEAQREPGRANPTTVIPQPNLAEKPLAASEIPQHRVHLLAQ